MKYELMNPEYIVYSLVIIIIIMFAWKKKANYKSGIIVANTKYVKNTGYYKSIMVKYRIYSVFVFICCISLIILGGILSARIFTRESKEEIVDNRDIVFCINSSLFESSLQRKIIDSLKETVSGLKNERFGIVAFDSSAATILPLTNSHTYALHVLEGIYEDANKLFSNTFFNVGTKERNNLEFSTGDGLASCAMSFKGNENRTKVIILLSQGTEPEKGLYVNTLEAGEICKQSGIVVYPIFEHHNSKCSLSPTIIAGLDEVANKTGGRSFDLNNYSSSNVIKEINSLSKSMLKKTVSTTKTDVPELIFQYLVIITGIMFIVDWRIRL